MKITLEKLIPAVFLLALLLLIGISFTSYKSTADLLENTRLVAHTLEVNTELNGALSALVDAETGQRGYLLTGKDQYLEPYNAALPVLGEKIKRLRALTADNPGQQRRLSELERLVAERQGLLKQTIELRRSKGDAFVVPIEALDAGKRLMDGIRALFGEMEAEERRLLIERQAVTSAAGRRTTMVILLGGLPAVALAGLAYLFIRRELERRRRSELQAQAFTRELERSNRELQDFAYVASHDLQEPLRKIQAFGDLLRSGYGESLPAEARDFVERMQNAARRMHVLINDLLTFSRVTTKGKPFAPVDLNQIAREVMGDLEVRLKQSGGSVDVGDLPTIDADATQMRQALQNLIGNALKFRRPEEPPVVKVSASQVSDQDLSSGNGGAPGDLCVLTVEDNGIGFDEKYLDRIFTPFQRLHARGDYEGTGMGLAVCRRIAERHGGSITARSAPGRGSTFSITLPVKQKGELPQ
jgi:signal transduction histidine kinase